MVQVSMMAAVWGLANPETQLPKPFRFTRAVNNAAHEPQRSGGIVTVEANILFGCLGVPPDPVLNIGRLLKHVSGMTSLRHLNDHSLLEIKYVLFPKHVHGPCAFDEFRVIERVIVRTPGNLRHIEVGRETKAPA